VNWDAIGAIGEIVGALAVVITLAFLTVQLRLSTKASRAQTAHDLSQSIQNYLLVQSQSDVLGDVWKKVDEEGYGSLDIREEFHFRGFVGALFYAYKNAHDQMKVGTITMEEWEEYRWLLLGLFDQWKPIRDLWENYIHLLPADFVKAVDGRDA
jgi:hypothetical protein